CTGINGRTACRQMEVVGRQAYEHRIAGDTVGEDAERVSSSVEQVVGAGNIRQMRVQRNILLTAKQVEDIVSEIYGAECAHCTGAATAKSARVVDGVVVNLDRSAG